MANITKATPVTDNKTDLDTIAPAVANEPTEFKLDTKEVSRILTRIRYRLNEAVRDANRRSPILSESSEVAKAKANSLVTVLREFSEQTF